MRKKDYIDWGANFFSFHQIKEAFFYIEDVLLSDISMKRP